MFAYNACRLAWLMASNPWLKLKHDYCWLVACQRLLGIMTAHSEQNPQDADTCQLLPKSRLNGMMVSRQAARQRAAVQQSTATGS